METKEFAVQPGLLERKEGESLVPPLNTPQKFFISWSDW
jgi:hypothetical protein